MKRVFILISLLVLLIFVGASAGRWEGYFNKLKNIVPSQNPVADLIPDQKLKIVSEESVIIEAVEKVSPSVVTVSIMRSRSTGRIFEFDPFDPFGFTPRQPNNQPRQQDIGTGFIITSDGLIVTNKHVVSDSQAKYKVITKDDKSYEVQRVYRDPTNDLAILKIDANNLTAVILGDSSKLKVGQMAVAIGTALGEFRNTVTVGVISGLGRGITAGSPFEGYVERLDDVIQTDAAINPGNSGGPLLNSGGLVIGMNTAVSSEGQNIGFAIPINIIKDALNQFNTSGKFQRPYLGVRYKMITRDLALLNDVPEGAYVQEVIEGSPAEKAGIENEDIISKIDGKKITEEGGGLAKLIADKKIGDRVSVDIWRDGETKALTVTVGEFSGE